jgi:hypothetical protein
MVCIERFDGMGWELFIEDKVCMISTWRRLALDRR